MQLNSYEERYINHAPELDECIARRRRFNGFKKASGLREEPEQNSVKHQAILKRLNIRQDHVSFWWDGTTAIVMNEPYNCSLSDFSEIALATIEVPSSIAPYCGGWSEKPDEAPGTKTFLHTELVNGRKLKEVEQDFADAASTFPDWNDIAGDDRDGE